MLGSFLSFNDAVFTSGVLLSECLFSDDMFHV